MKNICNTLLFADITEDKKAILYRRDATGTYKIVKSIRYASWIDSANSHLLVDSFNIPKYNEHCTRIHEFFPTELIHSNCVFSIDGMNDSPQLCIHVPRPDRDEAWFVIKLEKNIYVHVSSYQIFCEFTTQNFEE